MRLNIGILCLLTLFLGCQKGKSIEAKSLAGKWVISEAYRNGVLTKTLEDAFIEFVGDSLMYSNLIPGIDKSIYEVNKNVIYQRGRENIEYTIDKLTKDSLTLSSEIRVSHFQFVMIRDTVADLDSNIERIIQ